jgi:hypothetical protein
MLFKEVIVYTSYAEYSINRGIEMIVTDSLEEAARISRNKTQIELENQGMSEEELAEFYTNIRVKDGIGAMVDHGEEDIALILPPDNPFFDIVDDERDLYDNHFEKWKEMIESFCFEPANHNL